MRSFPCSERAPAFGACLPAFGACLPAFGACLLSLMCLSVLAPGQPLTQTLPMGLGSVEGSGSTNVVFNRIEDQKNHWHYDSAQFLTQSCITIQEIHVRADQDSPVAAWNFGNMTVTLGTATSDYQVANRWPGFEANMCVDATVVRTGPFSGGPIAPSGTGVGSWIPLGLTGTFSYDPSSGNDLVVQIEKCATTAFFGVNTDAQSGPTGTNGGNRYYHNTDCSAGAPNNSSNELVNVIRIDYTVGGSCGQCIPLWQMNQPGSDMTIDGVGEPGPGVPLVVNGFTNIAHLVSLASTNVGMPWDLAITSPEQGVPSTVYNVTTTSGQVANIDLLAPSLTFFYGLQFANSFAAATLPVTSTAIGSVSAQLIVLDPGYPEQVALSHLNTLNFNGPPVEVLVEALGPNTFNPITTSGFWRVTHYFGSPITSVAFDFLPSTNPAHAPVYFDTNQTTMADRFDGGNSTLPGCLGTYRNNSAVNSTLVFPTSEVSPCDPTARTGYVSSNVVGGFPDRVKTLTFSFTGFQVTTFEFDCDTDQNGIVAGGHMAGMEIRITRQNGSMQTGNLAADPADPDRSFIQF